MEKIFALDIGTRVVIGLIMHKKEQGYQIIASSRTEHTQRAMYDGQVHDVDEVARAVLHIKNKLQEKTGEKYKKVAVAAAGRALSTASAKASREEPVPIHWEKEEVLSLEMEAVQKAMKKIGSAEVDSSLFYCVGYNTIQYFLEDQPISSLIGQRGKKAEITVIATFLPRTVVDGLSAVLARAELEMTNLTLEPIAAGQAAIPPDMRRMNLALVDIGAGTADIALTKEGSFFAYGMVPMAGDEVTESICSHYLLDFQEGEKIKRNLKYSDQVEIINFFGEKTTVPKQEVMEIIQPTVQKMAEKITREILYLNKDKPQAVILVGGGSLTPLLGDLLSEKTGLPRNRIGIQVRERLPHIWGEEDMMTGADVVTPIGIGMASLDGKGLHYYSVTVNNRTIPLFELQLATVAEALLAAGVQPRSFLGRPGAALIYELNGKVKTIRGELGNPAQVLINGLPAKLEQRLNPDDCVTFMPGTSGQDAKARIQDEISIPPKKKLIWNGEEEDINPHILMDGEIVQADVWLKDGCKIRIQEIETLSDLLKFKGCHLDKLQNKIISVNREMMELAPDIEVEVNGQVARENCILRNGDRVQLLEKEKRIKDLALQPEPMCFNVNGKEFCFPPQGKLVLFKGKELTDNDLVLDEMELRVEGFIRKPILSELFPFLNIAEEMALGRRLEMLVNGKKAEFTTELNQGDRIILSWIAYQ
ncbi:MAG: Cell division protein FtsA [Candidatus Dichloromethanomonas elyunquensis]|nr:MAG: Cell division protein FtsA [Candidatus Dichloromethanomonas elyunquensis]